MKRGRIANAAVCVLASPTKMLRLVPAPMAVTAVESRHSLPSVQLAAPTAGFFTNQIAGPATAKLTTAGALLAFGGGTPTSVT